MTAQDVVTGFKHNDTPPKLTTATTTHTEAIFAVQIAEPALSGFEHHINLVENNSKPVAQPDGIHPAVTAAQLPLEKLAPIAPLKAVVTPSIIAVIKPVATAVGFQHSPVQMASLPPVPTAGMEVHFTRTDPSVGSFHVAPHQTDNAPTAPPMSEASTPALPTAGFAMPTTPLKPENEAAAANEATAWAAQLQILERENQALRSKLQMNETDHLSDIKVDAVAKIHEEVLRDRVAQLEKELDKLSMQKDRALPQKTATPPTPPTPAQIPALLPTPATVEKK
jgi:hypothetical protein